MGGIDLKNLRETSVIARNLRHGAELLLPPSDPQFICAFQGIESGTADANFTLNPQFVEHGQCLPWPQRIYVVAENNRLHTLGPPGVIQANPNLSGSRAVDVVITGKLNGKARSETLTLNIANLLSAGTQLSYVKSVQQYDEITSVRHQNKVGTWGASRNLFIGVGTGCSQLGEGSQTRPNVMTPIRPGNINRLKNLWIPEEGESHAYGSGTDAYDIDSLNRELNVPIRGRRFDLSLGACAVTSSTSARSVARVGHGLRQGDMIQVRPLDNGLPGGLRQPNTSVTRTFTAQATGDTLTLASHGLANGTRVRLSRARVGGVLQALPAPLIAGGVYYFVVGSAANTIQLSTSFGGSAVNITADSTGVGVTVVDTFYAMPLSADAFMISAAGCAFNAAFLTAGDTFGLTAHGLANGTPVLMQRAIVSGALGTLPTGFAELTPYFVVNTAADTFQLEATVGGGAITPASADTTVGIIPCVTLATGGNFASGETIEILRPRATWEWARMVYQDGSNVERGT